MLTLLSPAKSLDTTSVSARQAPTQPRFEVKTERLLKTMKGKSVKAIGELMGISKALSELNYARYQDFEAQEAMPAAFMFDGDVYTGLKARELDAGGMAFAQEHVRILSGLYGVLRPMDLIRPYRLEMGTSLKVGKSGSLYQFWGEDIAKSLMDELKAQGSDTILNLASQEYAKAALTKVLKARVINVRFLEIKGNEAKMISFFAKTARGLMARFVIDDRIDDADGVKAFDYGGYRFRADLSKPDELTFTRPQPAPVSR